MKRMGLCIIIISLVILSGCGKTTKTGKQKEQQIKLMVASPKSAAAIPLLSMIETNALGDDMTIDLKLYDDLGKMMAIATEDKYAFMVLQVHTAATLYNKGIGAKLLNVFGWGCGIYLSTTDPECSTWDDLKGKTLYVSAKGSIFDMMTQYFLSHHGLEIEEDVHVVYSSPVEISQLLKLGKVKYAVDVEPFATMNSQLRDYKVICDFSKEWQEIKGDQYAVPSIGVIVNDAIISHESERIELFNQAFEKALQWTVDHPKEAAGLAEKYMNADAELIQKAMPNYQFLYKKAIHVKQDTELYYEVLSSFKPESIGGKIPDESFYYNKE